MKQIQAYIQKHKLNDVVRALRKTERVTGFTALERQGFGLGGSHPDDRTQDMLSGIKLEVFCRDEALEPVVAAIERAAHTGLKGDGKIYISSIDQAIRISSGERGDDAV